MLLVPIKKPISLSGPAAWSKSQTRLNFLGTVFLSSFRNTNWLPTLSFIPSWGKKSSPLSGDAPAWFAYIWFQSSVFGLPLLLLLQSYRVSRGLHSLASYLDTHFQALPLLPFLQRLALKLTGKKHPKNALHAHDCRPPAKYLPVWNPSPNSKWWSYPSPLLETQGKKKKLNTLNYDCEIFLLTGAICLLRERDTPEEEGFSANEEKWPEECFVTPREGLLLSSRDVSFFLSQLTRVDA